MDIQSNLGKARAYRQAVGEKNKEEIKAQSGERLAKSLDRKFRTTFIGSLSAFEKEFAGLWGHDRPEDELSDNEYAWRLRWIAVRNNVLNNGNNQRRAAQLELTEYEVEWNRHNMNLLTKGNGNGKA